MALAVNNARWGALNRCVCHVDINHFHDAFLADDGSCALGNCPARGITFSGPAAWWTDFPLPPVHHAAGAGFMRGITMTLAVSELAPVLDPCCGSRMMWFDRADPRCLFGDVRSESITVTDRSHGNVNGTRTLNVEPDTMMDFRALPFADASFRLVVFDPPHLVRAGKRSWLAAKYGRLETHWRDDLRKGFAECFRVLKPEGVLIFKWSEVQIPVRDVLALTPQRPLFGHASGKRSGTHWLCFLKGAAQ